MTCNAYTYLSVLEALVSVNFCQLGTRDVMQCFVLKPTTGKYNSLNKRSFLEGFFQFLNKAIFYECVEVKEKILHDGDSL